MEQVHAESPDCPTGLAEHLRTMGQELESHMQKEEQVLFPLLARGHGAMAAMPITVMRMEHDDHGVALERLLALTNNITLPRAACNTWRALYLGLRAFKEDLMAHIHMENNILFENATSRAAPVATASAPSGAAARVESGARRGATGRRRLYTRGTSFLAGRPMAGSSFFALFDDIATILDDVSVLTKVAAKKTAGVLGDDLALNAQQVSGVPVNRELPVVWAVAKGSFINKLILVPAALLISAFAPWAVTPLLMVGGAFLCFEGVEKLATSSCRTATPPRATMPRAPRPCRTRRWTWWRSSATRSRAPYAPISSCRPRSSPSPWARWPRPISFARCWCCPASPLP